MSDTPNSIDFHKIVKTGDVARVRSILNKISTGDSEHSSPHSTGNNAHADVDVDASADTNSHVDVDVDVLDPYGQTPLHIAAQQGHVDIVQLLLHSNAYINAKSDINSQTSLHCASENGHFEVAQALINSGASINIKDKNESTPLHLAFKYDHLNIVKLLVDNGADVDIKDANGNSPLDIELQRDSFTSQMSLHLHGSSSSSSIGQVTNTKDPLYSDMFSVSDDGNLIVKHPCYQHGQLINNPLHVAAKHASPETIQLLVDRGADLTSLDRSGKTPLHYVTKPGNTELLIKISHDLNHNMINTHDNNGYIPLHIASQHGYTQIAVLLINAKSDINGKTNEGQTPLILASLHGYRDTVQMLINHQADIAPPDQFGFTALHMAIRGGLVDVAQDIMMASANGSKDGTDISNCYIDTQTMSKTTGNTFLHAATAAGCIHAITILLDKKADVHAKNNQGQTPLHLATTSSIAKLLVEHNADVNALDHNGVKPAYPTKSAWSRIMSIFD